MTAKMNKKSRINPGEMVYLAFMLVVVVRHFLSTTMFFYRDIESVLSVVTFVLGVFVTFKLVVDWTRYWRCHDVAVLIVTVSVLIVANLYIHHNYVWEYILLILGARHIDFKKILKTYVIIIGTMVVMTIGMSLLGWVENLVYYRNSLSDNARYAMGFIYCTDFAAHIFFLCVCWAYLRDKTLTYLEILCMGLMAAMVYILAEARNTTICMCMLVVVLLLMKITSKSEHKVLGSKAMTVLMTIFMPVLVILSVVLAIVYKSAGILSSLNSVLGSRISTNATAFSRYDIKLLGQPLVQHGLGGRASVGLPEDYFFIDSSYVSILLGMGVLAMAALSVMWAYITYRECVKERYTNALMFCVIALHCFIEHHLFHISYNPFFILMFAGGLLTYYGENSIWNKIKDKVRNAGVTVQFAKNAMSLLLFAVIVEVLAFNMASLTSVLNSYIFATDYDTVMYNAEQTPQGTYTVQDGMFITVDNIDRSVDSAYISLCLYDENNKLLDNETYVVDVFAKDKESGEYVVVGAYGINTGVPSSGYIYFDKEYDNQSLLFIFELPGEFKFDIESMLINPPKPFKINYLRMLFMYVVIIAIYYFGIEKKVAEPTEATVEVQKATEDFTSSGALRVPEHENMRAVYAAKSKVYIGVKRFFDIMLSGFAILCLSPIFLATAIAIKIEDNGPVFFVQYRAGKDLKPFKMWKFRSMYVNADEKIKEMMANSNEQTGHAFKMKNDPRITKVGKFIRKFSIDELPQLFNIFLGDMSIVGPRPILVFQMEECDDYDKQRLIVQPGLTCIWQVSGRANIKWDKWIELDLEYIEKMSVWTDIKLILKTIPCVLSGDGAY